MKTKITLLLLFISPIYAQVDPVNSQKLWIFSLSKIGSSIVPYEKEQFTDIFGPYKSDPRRNINSYEFATQKKFEDSKFAFYFDFFELTKRDYSLKYIDFQNRSNIKETPTPIGNYFRSQIRLGFSYSIFNNVSISFGSRYFRSELTDGFLNQFYVNFGQKYLGPEISIQAKTKFLDNFFIATRISLFLLYGKSIHNYSFVSARTDQGYIDVNIEPYTRVQGNEFLLKFGYYFTNNLFFTIGFRSTLLRIRPDDLRVYSGDSRFDNQMNIEYGLRKENSYTDYMQSIILELGIEL